jgi:hypothetical protein
MILTLFPLPYTPRISIVTPSQRAGGAEEEKPEQREQQEEGWRRLGQSAGRVGESQSWIAFLSMILLVIFSLSLVQCEHDVPLESYAVTFVFYGLIVSSLLLLSSFTSSYTFLPAPLTRSLRPPPPIRMTAAIDRTTRH